MKLKYLLVIFLILKGLIFANDGSAGLDFPMLEIGADAKGIAMGKAYSMFSDDSASAYWNPAGLSYLKGNFSFSSMKVQADSSDLFKNTNMYYLAGAFRLDKTSGVFAFNWFEMVIDDKQEYYDVSGNYLGLSDPFKSQVLILAYSNRFNNSISFGLNAKYYNQIIANKIGNGLGLDFGILSDFDLFKVAFVVKDFNSTKIHYKTLNAYDTILPKLILGIGVLPTDFLKFSLELEQALNHKHHLTLKTGFLWQIIPSFSLLGGLTEDDLSIGVGFNFNTKEFKEIGFNYTYVDNKEFNQSYRLSLSLDF